MNPVRANSKPILQSNGVNQNLTASFPSANLTEIETVINPFTDTEAICDFGVGKEVEIIAGTVTVTGLGTVTIYVDGVLTSTMIADAVQELRIELAAPVAITEVAVFENNGTRGTLDLYRFKTNLFDHKLFEGAGTIALDTGKSINATHNASWLLSQSGCNDTLAANPTEPGEAQLIDQEYNIFRFHGNRNGHIISGSLIPTGANNRRVEVDFIYLGHTNQDACLISQGNNSGGVSSIWLRRITSTNCQIFYSGYGSIIYSGVNFNIGEKNTVILACTNGQIDGVQVTVNSVLATPSATPTNALNTNGTSVSFMYAISIGTYFIQGALLAVRAYNAATAINIIGNWVWNPQSGELEDISGNDQANITRTSVNSEYSYPVAVIEDTANIGNDLCGVALQKSIKISGTQKKWNTYLQTWYESLDTLSVNEFVAMFVIDGSNLSTLTNAILLDARDADDDGILLWINASGYPEIQYNTQDLADSLVLDDARQIITFWATDTDLKIRIDGTEVATATKTGGTISTTSKIVLLAESFGTKSKFFNGQLCEAYYIPQNVALATVQSIENAYITEYSI